MWIEVGHSLCRVKNATEEEQDWVRRYLSFEDAKFGQARGKKISMFSTIKGTFPGGLLPLVQKAAARENVTVELLDLRQARVQPDPNADLAWLRPYQLEAVDACVARKRGIVRSPTASGKGDMIVGLVRKVPGTWLFLVHRENLVGQQADRYRRITGDIPNEITGGDVPNWRLRRGLNLMTLQSLAAGLRSDKDAVRAALSALDGVVVDECHVAAADVYYSSIMMCSAEYRLGFSGTPLDRSDNRSLMAVACLGEVIYSIKPQVLVDAGFLAAPEVTVTVVRQARGNAGGRTMKQRAKAYHDAYDELIMDSEVRNDAVVKLAVDAPKPCMVFVQKIDHGKALTRLLKAEGLATEFVWGEKNKESRKEAVKRLERGDSEVLVASVVFQEGVDIPSLASVIIASGGKSVIAALQRVGRGMRTDGGKKATFPVYDILDLGSPMMERHSRRRMNTYVREGYSTVIAEADGKTTAYQPKLKTRREKKQGL